MTLHFCFVTDMFVAKTFRSRVTDRPYVPLLSQILKFIHEQTRHSQVNYARNIDLERAIVFVLKQGLFFKWTQRLY